MKKLKALILLFISITVIAFSVSCGDGTDNNGEPSSGTVEYVFRVSDDEKIIITRCKSQESVVQIPAEIDGKPVVAISDKAFFMNSKAVEIIIPSGVETIGTSAFEACSVLKKITISSTVNSIGDMAFNNCPKLEDIIVESGSALKQMGKDVFSGCRALKTNEYENTRYLPNEDGKYEILISVTSTDITSAKIHPDTKIILAKAFSQCKSLKEIEIPENVEHLGSEAFSGCSNLDMIYYNPIRLTDLYQGSAVFKGAATNSRTMTLKVGKNVERIPAYLFDSADRFRILTFDENTVCSEIGECAFAGTPLKELTIPKSMKIIEDRAFYKCIWLDKIKLNAASLSDFDENNNIFQDAMTSAEDIPTVIFGKTAEHVPDNFLRSLDSIQTVRFEDNSVTKSIGKNVFLDCNNIHNVFITSSKDWCESTFENEYSNPLFYGNAYLYINDNTATGIFIPNETRFISDYAFINYKNVEMLFIPQSIKYVGESAFSGTSNLNTVFWGAGQATWNILDIGNDNAGLTDAKTFFYHELSLGKPTAPGNHWYYSSTGIPTPWPGN